MLLVAGGLALCSGAFAGEPGHRGRGRADVEVVVPIEPYEHDRLQWFGRRDHHVVPGTVTIDKAPYMCDPHRRRFEKREAFVAHLRADHRLLAESIPDTLVVLDGVVHFPGEQ